MREEENHEINLTKIPNLLHFCSLWIGCCKRLHVASVAAQFFRGCAVRVGSIGLRCCRVGLDETWIELADFAGVSG